MAGAGVVAEAAGAGLGEESFTDEELGIAIPCDAGMGA